MSDITITIATPSGPQRLPLVQAQTLLACCQALQDDGKQVIWHWNECRCCISVHEKVDRGEWVREGFVINARGEAAWHTDLNHREGG